ncbi:MAG: HNH endonuclease [Hydrogenophaga sp.]|uniref:HNH endonuclease n=1 Tax=Hydrogenophaga sp. TaxID=1904254 RepID=UPI0025C29FA0|nr:HNH endonuclease [Hydrogenophaga sp.]MBU7575481.1 HNH endonuclease [Hydrogenophaga sp.]
MLAKERFSGRTHSGRNERKAHLRALWAGGIPAYTVIVTPKFDKTTNARSIGVFSPDVVFPILRLVEEDELIFAVLGAAVSVDVLPDHMQSHRAEASAVPLPQALADSRSDGSTDAEGKTARSQIDWTDEELQASVASYAEMMRLDAAGTPYVKAHYYRQLAKEFDRVEGAFERRMQNISYLLDSRGLTWLQGLKPQENVGANVEPRLVEFLGELFTELAPPQTFPEDIGDLPGVIEGAKKQIVVNAYERDSTAKLRCIKRWDCVCFVCKFDFHAVYGDLGKGFIHVHHLKPIHTIGEEYVLDPENDLRPVCPNCHAMLHRKKDVLSIEELVGLLKLRFSY